MARRSKAAQADLFAAAPAAPAVPTTRSGPSPLSWLPGRVGDTYRLPDGDVVLLSVTAPDRYELSRGDQSTIVGRRDFMRALKKARLWTGGPWTAYEVPCLRCWQPVRIGHGPGERGPRALCDRCEAEAPAPVAPTTKEKDDDVTDEQLSVF